MILSLFENKKKNFFLIFVFFSLRFEDGVNGDEETVVKVKEPVVSKFYIKRIEFSFFNTKLYFGRLYSLN